MLPHPTLQPDRKKVREPCRHRHRAHIPRYAGRWPFIGIPPDPESREDGRPPKMQSVRGNVTAPFDNTASTIQRNPLVAVGIAAGVGFALALAFAEREG